MKSRVQRRVWNLRTHSQVVIASSLWSIVWMNYEQNVDVRQSSLLKLDASSVSNVAPKSLFLLKVVE